MSLEQLKTRSEVSEMDKWNVEALYPSLEKWEEELDHVVVNKNFPHWPEIYSYKGRLNEGPQVLKEVLDLLFSLGRKLEKLQTYAHLRHDEDITNDAYKAAYQKISSFSFDFEQECSWFSPEVLSLSESLISSYLESDTLAPYRFHLEKIVYMRPHTLSAEKEELLAMAGKPLQASPKAFSALNNADIKFSPVQDTCGKENPLSHGLYQLYLRSHDRVLRENAFKVMHGHYKDLENTLCELLSGEIQSHYFEAKARRFPSCVESAIYSKKIPVEVYRSLIQAVRQGLPALHDYVKLRKKILQLDEIHLYDMYVPLVPQADIRMDYSEAEDLVIRSVAPLGTEYQELLRKGFKEQKWVDRFENKNKRSGAYSSGCYDSYPYILMNYRGILRDVFTLAHEAGHSMHSLLSRLNQSYQDSHYPIFVAEVASTFNEELLMHLLLEETEQSDQRLFLINEKIEDIRATLFRQTMFAEFELKIHECVEQGVPLTPVLLKEMYLQLNQDYFGPEATIDTEIAIEWARIPHFYYNFYVYQYATGISAALSLAKKVLAKDETARDAYLSFLKAGGSLYPIDLLKLAGVDMTTPQPVSAAISKFHSLVQEMGSLHAEKT